MRWSFIFTFLYAATNLCAQPLSAKLEKEIRALQQDEQFKHAIIGMYVVNNRGDVVYAKNAETGLAPASTQKIVTSITSFEMLKKDYRFKTGVGYTGNISNKQLKGNLVFTAGGDPTLASWRWQQTTEAAILNNIKAMLHNNGISSIVGGIVIHEEDKYLYPPVPNGWIWEDIGNYYGAGAWGVNWHENQYDVHLASDDVIGKPVRIVYTSIIDVAAKIDNAIVSAAKGSGDNAYLFTAPFATEIFANGTIPVGEKDFVISGALPNPPLVFVERMTALLQKEKLLYAEKTNPPKNKISSIGTISSPTLDSINFWFLKKSINLYGEALVKAIALQKKEVASTAVGVEIIKNFWATKGIEKSALKIIDGSGLSPANRITAKALVQLLQYAIDKEWFASFNNALPEMNGIKMKDGYISGVRAYAGYVNGEGEKFTFAFIVNNFDGSAATVREKMYNVLNLLK